MSSPMSFDPGRADSLKEIVGSRRIKGMRPESTQVLAAVRSWPERAAKAHYRVDELAELCGVSIHTLRVFFAGRFKNTIKKQLRQERIREVKRRLGRSEQMKNISIALGYRNSGNLIRDFKAVCGMTPGKWRRTARSLKHEAFQKKKQVPRACIRRQLEGNAGATRGQIDNS